MATPLSLEDIVMRARSLAASIANPEMPGRSIASLGILHDVQAVPMALESGDSQGYIIEITLKPPAGGCAALDQIRDEILDEMDAENIPARVKTVH